MMTRDDASLRELYARLQAARLPHARAGDIPVETIYALASGSYIGADREALLDDVLGNAATHAEFQFFRDVARGQPRHGASWFRSWGRPLALAASAVFVVALGARLLAPGTSPDPLRGDDSAIVVLPAAPSDGGSAWRFTWRAVPQAVGYELEVMDTSGQVVATTTTEDSTVEATLRASVSDLRWYVTARLSDGRSVRSAVQEMRLRR